MISVVEVIDNPMARKKQPYLAKPRLRLLLAGLGAMGNHWLRVIAASDEVELVAAVEVNPELAREQSNSTA